MGTRPVIAGLIHKRAEIAGQIEHLHKRCRDLSDDLAAVDRVLRLFDPEIKVEAIRSKPVRPPHAAKRGELVKLAATFIRLAERPVTTAEVSAYVIEQRGMDAADPVTVKLMTKRTKDILNLQQKRGAIVSEMGPDRLLVWSVK